MKQIKRILVCIDLSDYSAEITDYAKTFRQGFGAEIILLNIINQKDIEALRAANNYYPEQIDIDGYIRKVCEDRTAKLQELCGQCGAGEGVCTRTEVGFGVPFEEILKTVDAEQADLVIMGNKGRSNLASTLFGSTAEKVFKYARVPVVSVRSGP